MPELIEIETYRTALQPIVGSRLDVITASRLWTAPGIDGLIGSVVSGVDRRGKLLLVHLAGSCGDTTLGVRAGMTGRVVVDGVAPIGPLRYGPSRDNPEWVRSRWDLSDPASPPATPIGHHVVEWLDPRHLGRFELPAVPDRLGPDALRLGRDDVALLASGRRPIKAVLLDQSRLAGLGNLLADEVLWRSGIDPRRPAGSLSAEEIDVLSAAIPTVVAALTERGGSHRGVASDPRNGIAECRECGAAWERTTVGGRTTWWCPRCQPPGPAE